MKAERFCFVNFFSSGGEIHKGNNTFCTSPPQVHILFFYCVFVFSFIPSVEWVFFSVSGDLLAPVQLLPARPGAR